MIIRDYDRIIQQTEKWISSQKIDLSRGHKCFSVARKIAKLLGASFSKDHCLFGVWAPEIDEREVESQSFRLELFRPLDRIDFRSPEQNVRFYKEMIPMVKCGSFYWALLDHVTGGTKDKAGDFYQFSYEERGERKVIYDPLATSLPYGVFSPAEVYNWNALGEKRNDKNYYENLKKRFDCGDAVKIKAPANLLQIHPGTASKEGTIEGLTRIYRRISEKIKAHKALEPFEMNFVEYDGIQLMPIEPIIEHENKEPFWRMEASTRGKEIIVNLRAPDMTNWGYDIVISGMAGVNPVILGSKRPDEMVELIEVLHNFPVKPIKVILDVVYGHSDNQGLKALNRNFFTGSNMYGQDMNFRHPMVRSILLEMQRRKGNFGIDGLRVDGAQDFKYYDEEKQQLLHDDAYLQLMSDVIQEVCGIEYSPWMIFEDGRPWPQQDWELTSSYRSVIEKQPEIYQWGPLTFAHNTPFLYTFWATRWWRVREIMEMGNRWITGCSNHDTLRRGSQVDPEEKINNQLGKTLPDIIKNAYDNSAEKIITYALMPGIPMDFINASMRGPWSFVRNTDDTYGVKVVSEEKAFLDWRVPRENFEKNSYFTEIKSFGIKDYNELYRTLEVLEKAVKLTDYDLSKIVDILNDMIPVASKWTIERLKAFAKAWMNDVHFYCKIHHYAPLLKAETCEFHQILRRFRRERSWLMNNLREEETYGYLHPTRGSVIYYGLRVSPENKEKFIVLAHMEGKSKIVSLEDLPINDLDFKKFEIFLASPGLETMENLQKIHLKNGDGMILCYNNNPS